MKFLYWQLVPACYGAVEQDCGVNCMFDSHLFLFSFPHSHWVPPLKMKCDISIDTVVLPLIPQYCYGFGSEITHFTCQVMSYIFFLLGWQFWHVTSYFIKQKLISRYRWTWQACSPARQRFSIRERFILCKWI